MFSKLRANFFTGVLVIIPFVLTYWVMFFIVNKLNDLLLEPAVNAINKWTPAQNIEIISKLLLLIILVSLLILIGFATRIIILKNIFRFGEKILYKVPMINTIYTTIKEMSHAFLMPDRTIFRRVVLVEYPRKGLYQLGFVVSEAKGDINKKIGTSKSALILFIPTTPNPTSGILIITPEEETIPLEISVQDGLKMVISGGVVSPKH